MLARNENILLLSALNRGQQIDFSAGAITEPFNAMSVHVIWYHIATRFTNEKLETLKFFFEQNYPDKKLVGLS
jgi:hypothetical protein